MNHICFNGKLVNADEPVLLASNRGYRYGDGLFETMKLVKGRILFFDDHLERLFLGLKALQIEKPALFTREKIGEEILTLCRKNNCERFARIRLSVSRGFGGLYDENQQLQYIIEAWPLHDHAGKLNENGLIIGISPGPRKVCDNFSHIKSANFLPYSWAAVWAKRNQLNDVLILNTQEKIADATTANCFIVTGEQIITPSIEQGCIAGVMRRHLLKELVRSGYTILEDEVTSDHLESADELFLTNVISGIRWVKECGGKLYTNKLTTEIYNRFVKTILV